MPLNHYKIFIKSHEITLKPPWHYIHIHFCWCSIYGGFHKWGYPKWMVYNRKSNLNDFKSMIWGYPHDFGNLHLDPELGTLTENWTIWNRKPLCPMFDDNNHCFPVDFSAFSPGAPGAQQTPSIAAGEVSPTHEDGPAPGAEGTENHGKTMGKP